MRDDRIVPILLAAGPSRGLPFPKALAAFADTTALEIAAANCAGYEQPIVVLGCHAARIRHAVPSGLRVIINRGWRAGQHSSLLAALGVIPRCAAILVYPVDHPLLTRALVSRVARAFFRRRQGQFIVLPLAGKKVGHPTIFASELREELLAARTARDVVYADSQRVKFVKLNSDAVWLDFDNAASYRRCLREYSKIKRD